MFANAEAALRNVPNGALQRIVQHVQKLWGIPSLEECLPTMSRARSCCRCNLGGGHQAGNFFEISQHSHGPTDGCMRLEVSALVGGSCRCTPSTRPAATSCKHWHPLLARRQRHPRAWHMLSRHCAAKHEACHRWFCPSASVPAINVDQSVPTVCFAMHPALQPNACADCADLGHAHAVHLGNRTGAHATLTAL
jgi:hypothetical protein